MKVGTRPLVAKSCAVCGELKDAKHFTIVQKIYRCAWCHTCKNKQSLPGVRKHQQEIKKRALRSGQPWTGDDLNRLDQMVSEGRTVPVIALELERTVYAVYTMKNKLFRED